MNQLASVTKLHQAEETDNRSESPEISVAKVSINLHKFPQIPDGASIARHDGEGYLPEFWDGDLNTLRTIPITPGPEGYAGKVFKTLISAGELNLTANPIEHLLGVGLPDRFMGKLLIFVGTRYGYLKNGIIFVRAISTFEDKIEEVCLTARDAVPEKTFALVLKD